MIDQSMFWKFLTTILAGTNFEIRAFLVRMILTNTFLTFKDNLVPRLSLSCSPPPPPSPRARERDPGNEVVSKKSLEIVLLQNFFFMKPAIYKEEYIPIGVKYSSTVCRCLARCYGNKQ